MLRTVAFTALALIAFAANSLFCRWAIGAETIDPAGFAFVRAATGFATLALLTRGRWNARLGGTPHRWWRTLAWIGYAVAFSYSYVRLDTGIGALVLFGVTQVTMVGWGWRRGDRPRVAEWVGLLLALGGLAWLTVPGADAPDPLGLALMAVAGVGWGSYSLFGRGGAHPLAANCDAFLRSLPALGAVALIAWAHAHWSARGVALASASGVLATGIGYSLWYAALPALSRTRAAVVQLAVPIIAAGMGVAVLHEVVSGRLLLAGALTLGGIGLAVGTRPAPDRAR